MLDERIIEVLAERLVNRIERENEYIIKMIAESVKKIGTLSPSKAQQLAQILKYGGNYEKILKKIAETTGLNLKDIDDIFKEIAKENQNFAEKFYDYKNVDFIPYEKNEPLRRQVEAFAEITKKQYANISKTTAIGYHSIDNEGNILFTSLKQTYNNIIDEAVLSIYQGKETFDSKMYRMLKEIGTSGLRYVDYESGRTMRLDSAIRMNMREGLTKMANEIQRQFGKEFGADGVEISVHENPAKDHEMAQGRQFTYKEYEKLQQTGIGKTYDGIEVDMHIKNKNGTISHTHRPIGTNNCYHTEFSIIIGVSEPEYSNKQLNEIIERNNEGFEFEGKRYTNYEGTQLQRKIELEVRKQKDLQILGRNSGNEKLAQESQMKINQLIQKYSDLCKISGLTPYKENMRVSGYRKIKVK